MIFGKKFISKHSSEIKITNDYLMQRGDYLSYF